MKQETFDRIEGLTSIKDTNILRNILMRMSEYLYHTEGFDKEDIIEFFKKVVEIEIDDILDDEE